MKFVVIAITLLIPFSIEARSVEDLESARVIKGKYLEDYQVFYEALYSITDSPLAKYKADDFGFNIENEAELIEFQKFQVTMRSVQKRIDRTSEASWYKNNCSDIDDFTQMSRKKMINNMDAYNENRNKIIKRFLGRTLKSMSSEMRLKITDYLKSFKNKVVITEVDTAEFVTHKTTDSMRSDFSKRCINDK